MTQKLLFVFASLSIVVLSCKPGSKGTSGAASTLLDKTYDVTAIPPTFNKGTAQVLLVVADFKKKKYKKRLAEIVKENYKGNSEVTNDKADLDKLYEDTNKYRFILYETSELEIRHSTLDYNNAVGVMNVQYVMHDRLEKKNYPRFFRDNRNWQTTAVYVLEKLNERLK